MNVKVISPEDRAELLRLASDADVKIAEAQLAAMKRDQFANVTIPQRYGIDGAYQIAPDGTLVQGEPAPPNRQERRAVRAQSRKKK